MTLDASGYLLLNATSSAGVGTTRYQVGSTSSATSQILLQGTSTHLSLYAAAAAEAYVSYAVGSALIFGNGPADGSSFTSRARIDSSGNLLVGTTSSAPNGVGAGFQINYAAGAGSTINIGHPSSAGSGYSYAIFSYNNTIIGSIGQNGTTGVTYNTSSDYRLKENIKPMTGALAKVAALKPCTYTWKSDGSDGEGFIAHELAEVCPDAVTGEKDAVDEEGNIKPQGIDTSFLVATLTAAIQELKAELDATKAEVALLKGAA
jgi:hypothetical protein